MRADALRAPRPPRRRTWVRRFISRRLWRRLWPALRGRRGEPQQPVWTRVSAAIDAGQCASRPRRRRASDAEVRQLPRSVRRTLRRNLAQGADTVAQLAHQNCHVVQHKQTTTTRRPPRLTTTKTTTAASEHDHHAHPDADESGNESEHEHSAPCHEPDRPGYYYYRLEWRGRPRRSRRQAAPGTARATATGGKQP